MGRIMVYLAEQHDSAGVQFKCVESRGAGAAAWSAWHAARAAYRIAMLRWSAQAGIVHLNVGEGASVVRKGCLLVFARALRLPVVLHLHAADIEGFYTRLPRIMKILVERVFLDASSCIVVGDFHRIWLEDQLLVPRDRIAVIPNGVPRIEFQRLRGRNAGFVLLFLGNLLPRKGLADLLRAVAGLDTHWQWKLQIAGSGNAGPARSLAADLGIAARVAFLGWVDRGGTHDLLQAADALVLPSYHEALPLVLLEAASQGVPIVATNVGAIAEYFVPGQDALLVSAGDVLALSKAIECLLADGALRNRLSWNARQLYEKQFTIKMFAERLGAVYARLCRSSL
ncbi:MAG TPA: glycosyltransferase family 4 protein [Acetobacteraceae bacterium]|nr:glycosyltransferase family 4 protein [Acetobacteraceae bacterium]